MLLHFWAISELGRQLTRNRREILDLSAALGIRSVRIFGSVARGLDNSESDIDLLTEVPAGNGLFRFARLESELKQLLGAKVDLVPAGSLRARLTERVLAETVPL